MSGEWLAMGAVAALAAVGASRRGSASADVVLGYHCTMRPIVGQYGGRIRDVYADRIHRIIDALPYTYHDRLWDLDVSLYFDPEEHEEEDAELQWGRRVLDAIRGLGVEWIWVAERPLSLGGSMGHSAYGNECYVVRISEAAVLGAFIDHDVATGGGGAFAVLYDANKGRPKLEPVDLHSAPEIEFPLEAVD